MRGRFSDELVLQADDNGAYTLVEADRLARLDPFGLLLVGWPLADETCSAAPS